MGFWRKAFEDYFDERGYEISRGGGNDNDSYDERNEVMDPGNPIWRDSEVHINPYGTDPTMPDPNELNQD
jgi:hypothetical protein